MSQLIDKLTRISKTAPQTMGFRTAKDTAAKSRLLLIASVNHDIKAADPAEIITGADAVLLKIDEAGWTAESLQDIKQTLGDTPWGIQLKNNPEEAEKASKAGSDFLLFTADSKILPPPKAGSPGRILQVEPSLDSSLLKTLNELPVDAVAAGMENADSPTWHQLMFLQRLADTIIKPVLVFIPAKVTDDELRAIWETGIDGVIAPGSTAKNAGSIKKLRQAIDKLPPLASRRAGKTGALIPHITSSAPDVADIEEDDDE